jgi:hypothetical protein
MTERSRLRSKGPVFVIRLRGRPGADGIRSLRAILKNLLRHHRLRCISIGEERAA